MRKVKSIATASMSVLALSIAQAQAATIDNASFEDGWDNWVEINPAAISSSDSYSGNKSAKVTGNGGGFEQVVSVAEYTDYTLTAWVLGSGTVGAEVGSFVESADVEEAEEWEQVTLSFNSGANTEITVYGAYYDESGRFDRFSLEETGYSSSTILDNASFEDGWDYWTEIDPAAISGDAYTGDRSAKVTGSDGGFEQIAYVDENTDYTLTAWVLGSGSVGADVGYSTESVEVEDADDWEKVTVSFNSGTNSFVTVFGRYYEDDGRFDGFSLVSDGESSADDSDSSSDESSTDDSSADDSATDDSSSDDSSTDTTETEIDITVNNASFEEGWDDWVEIEPAAISSDAYAGDKSAKVTGKNGRFEQTITVAENTDYELSAWVLEAGAIGVDIGSSTEEVSVDDTDDEWEQLTVAFNSGDESSITIFGRYYEDDGRFDAFSLTQTSASSNSNDDDDSDSESDTDDSSSDSDTTEDDASTDDSGSDDSSSDESDSDNTDDSSSDTSDYTASLDPNGAPSDNFELVDWYLSIPTDDNDDGKADSIKEEKLSSGYEHEDYFYTAADGGMVFKDPIDGYKTSSNTDYTRVELREMLRRGDTSVETSGVNKNNWVFSSTTEDAQEAAGGVDGILSATLAVNHVTTTGDDDQVGRVVVGQIHANSDEPARLYYRKLPGNTNGSIYLAHEPTSASGEDEQWYDLIGSRDDDASDPIDGIALDEVFSYEIKVDGDDLWVTISREGESDVVQYVDMSDSGYDADDRYQYFKAGVYNQNKSGDDDDYVQATFYKLENSHDGYDY